MKRFEYHVTKQTQLKYVLFKVYYNETTKKIKEKERILKAGRGKNLTTYK